jgi:hypothetical protein
MTTAVATASGHNNLPNGNFVPEIFSKTVLKFFRRASVAEAITNTDYYGEIANFGDTVHVIDEPTIVVSDYARGTQLQTQALDDSEQTLLVDQAKYFQFIVDDLEAKQAHLNWETLSTSAGAYALKNSYDSAILSYMAGQVLAANVYGVDHASTSIDVGYDSGEISPLGVLSRMGRLLDEQDVPEEGRFVVASPLFWEVMSDENSKLMGVDFTGDTSSKLRNGRITDGLIRGFQCYKTNNAPIGATVGVGTTGGVVLGGHMSSTATVSQIAKTEALRSQDFFGDIVRGLHLYGRKTLRTAALTKTFYRVD